VATSACTGVVLDVVGTKLVNVWPSSVERNTPPAFGPSQPPPVGTQIDVPCATIALIAWGGGVPGRTTGLQLAPAFVVRYRPAWPVPARTDVLVARRAWIEPP
jgi:hypothetical protein